MIARWHSWRTTINCKSSIYSRLLHVRLPTLQRCRRLLHCCRGRQVYSFHVAVARRILIGATALLLYECAIILHREVYCMWRSGINRSTAIFLLNRCIILFMAIMCVMDLPFWTTLIVLDGLIDDASGAMWAVFSSLRVYAVCERRWSPAVLTTILGFAPVAMNLAYQATSSLTVDDGTIQQLVKISDSAQLKSEYWSCTVG
ncbi:hypothetical protein WOLCODRAFT_110390 [Wolfiporia cocos MD-104 SS10]|uniref:DUF6533 domain-containing protein n=1 Tax=Wolfiporia cocos (strain MD-104) TaxID=742152 RepID=A0A2H3JSG8_WOLCO|nr:hypothetical protein WOLCODRAFT_110390 [Wolfiporia cocos MD-104 SS10]